MSEDSKQPDLTPLIEQYKKEIWEWKQKESEWIKVDNQLKVNKQIIEEMSNTIVRLKNELEEVKRDNTKLADEVGTRVEQLRKAGL